MKNLRKTREEKKLLKWENVNVKASVMRKKREKMRFKSGRMWKMWFSCEFCKVLWVEK